MNQHTDIWKNGICAKLSFQLMINYQAVYKCLKKDEFTIRFLAYFGDRFRLQINLQFGPVNDSNTTTNNKFLQ